MGSFVFKWKHPATEVYVTGTFDDWAKSVKLEKEDSHFEKLVELPLAKEKIYYKFVVDGNWITDHTAPQEVDGASNVNNVLLPKDITETHTPGPAAAGMMSGVTPQSTTAGLAGDVPKDAEREMRSESASSDVPGSFPETPFHDAAEFTVDPVSATSGTGNPGTSDTVTSTTQEEPSLNKSTEGSEQIYGVAPLPATSGIGNPVSLQPGEKIPHHSKFTQNTVYSNVTTDEESYNRAGGAPQLPEIVTSDSERDGEGGMLNLPAISNNMIPESSLPMGEGAASASDPGVMIQSAGSNSTTATFAGKVPLEPRGVPQIVSESQQEAGVGPGASGNRDAVKEKTAVEKELEANVPEEPVSSEGTAGVVGGVAAGSAVAAASAAASRDLPASVQQSIDEINKGTAIAPEVPDVVQESIAESHWSPEAAGSKRMVGEKSAMENELLKAVPRDDGVGAPSPSTSAAFTESAPAPTGSGSALSTPAKDSAPAPTGSENVLPTPAKESAPVTTAAAPAQAPAGQNAMKQALQSRPDSRDVSPMSKPINPPQTQPTVTTGVGSSSTQTSQATTKDTTQAKPSPAATSSAAASNDKKSKRSSGFFGKLKSKFSDKDKK